MPNPLERRPPGLLIFDCDGVLVDSELIDARICSECFQAEGFPVTAEDLRQNPGISGAGLAEMIQERFGRPLPDGFMQATRAKIMEVFTEELQAIDGIAELLGSLTIPVCVASNSHTDRVRHSLQVTDPPGECLVVEDSVHGITAALAAGTEAVGVCGGSHCQTGHPERLLSAGCKRIFARTSEVGQFLNRSDRSG